MHAEDVAEVISAAAEAVHDKRSLAASGELAINPTRHPAVSSQANQACRSVCIEEAPFFAPTNTVYATSQTDAARVSSIPERIISVFGACADQCPNQPYPDPLQCQEKPILISIVAQVALGSTHKVALAIALRDAFEHESFAPEYV